MEGHGLQMNKTRYTRYLIAYHLVWIPKYRRRNLTGAVQKATKRLIEECCEWQGLMVVTLETDEDHIHVCVSAPPRFARPDASCNHSEAVALEFERDVLDPAPGCRMPEGQPDYLQCVHTFPHGPKLSLCSLVAVVLETGPEITQKKHQGEVVLV
jgi:hypothetical protein